MSDGAAEAIARAFHEAYERSAPALGYETREESRVPWDRVPHRNRVLMVSTVRQLLVEGKIAPGPLLAP